MPKERATHPPEPGQGKTERVNASESSLRLRNRRTPDRWVSKTALLGQGSGTSVSLGAGTRPRSREGTHPRRISVVRNVVTPMGSGDNAVVGQPTVRAAHLPSGTGTVEKAKATTPKGDRNS